MNRSAFPYVVRAFAIAMVLLAMFGGNRAAAHPELVRAVPAPDALLAAPPRQIEIWFSERIDVGAGSPHIELVSESGQRLMADARIPYSDSRHVIATIDGLDFGTWTVAWRVRSLDDGHTLTGSYAFRIGSTSRAPGAATTEDERPQAWNVITRWLTFLGAALTAGTAGYIFLADGRIIGRASMTTAPRRLRPLALFGAGLALLATLAEAWLFTVFPPANAIAPSLGEALDSQPGGWSWRVIWLFFSLLFATGALVARKIWHLPLEAGFSALTGVLGLSSTGHAAARHTLRTEAIAVNYIHQVSIALWIGILLVIVLSWRQIEREAISRFSIVALPLVLTAILAGVVNSVFALPELSALWTTDYGRVIIIKVLGLGGILFLALFNRSLLARVAKAGADQLRRLRLFIRAETGLAMVVVLGGSILSLTAPARVAETSRSSIAITHYSAPAPRAERLLTTLHLDPAKPGLNNIGISVTDLDGNAIPNDAIQRITVDFTSLTQQTSQNGVQTTPGDDGIWRVTGLQLSIADWWKVEVNVRRAGLNDAVAEFFIVLPDPNVSGFPDEVEGTDDPAARTVFEQGLASLTSLHRVTYSQQIATGTEGGVVLAWARVNDGFDGSTPASEISTEQTTSITIGTTRWLSQASSGRWGATQSNPPVPPFEWGDEYAAATGFRLGSVEDVNGEAAQIVTFYTPQTNLAPAFYAWWVSVETGQLVKIAMVSRVHYMTQIFADFDGDVVIEPPVREEGTPVSTPGIDLTTIGG